MHIHQLIACIVLFPLMLCVQHAHGQPDTADRYAREAERSVVEVEDLFPQVREAVPDVVILDVRDEEAYLVSHLPNAVRVSYEQWDETSRSTATGLEHVELWYEQIGSLGIGPRDTVFIYDDGRMTRAARIWYVLQHFGVERAVVINGGFPLIEDAAQRGIIRLIEDPIMPEPGTFRPSANNEGRIGLLDRDQVKAAIDSGEAQILDARTADEYRGIDLRKNTRGGHLPTARNVPHASLLDANGRLRSVDELADILDDAGFQRGRVIITHCDGGGRAALAALAAARAGYGPVLNYYLSFSDWAADASCPIVSPE